MKTIRLSILFSLVTSLIFAFFGPQTLRAAHLSGDVSLSGWVKNRSGEAMAGVFVKVTDRSSGMTVSVLSQRDGTFRLDGLRSGKHDIAVQRMGYQSVQHSAVTLSSASQMHFTMQPGPINPFDPGLSRHQWREVLPEGKWKEAAIGCGSCHSLSGFTARRRYDVRGWLSAINFMNVRQLGGTSREQSAGIAEYLAHVFGPAADPLKIDLIPKPVDERALNIVYLQYPIPTSGSVSHTAVPDSQGKIWFTEYGANKIGVVNTETGKAEEFEIPTPDSLPHGITLDRSGNVWFTEHSSRAAKIAKLDRNTGEFTEYTVPQTIDTGRHGGRPGPHTLMFDSQGILWFTDTYADFMRKFDPASGKITEYPIQDDSNNRRANVYGMDIDARGWIWFTAMNHNRVGYIDPATDEITMFSMLTENSRPRRIKVDSKGIAWTGLYGASKLARIDPETGEVREYDLPVADAQPYPVGIDGKDRIWVGTNGDDKLVMFDPVAERFTSYPEPQRGNGLRDFFMDAQGWFWCVQMGHDQILGFRIEE